MKHKFITHPEGDGNDFCKFKLCVNCGCIKEVWRNGSSYRLNNVYYNNEPKCIKK